jgi:hypothetical protein
LLCFQVIPVNPSFITSDYRGREGEIVLGLILEASANCHTIVLLHRQETGHKFYSHTSHLQIFSYNFLAHTECYSNFLCNLTDNQTSVSMNVSWHTCHSLLGVGGGWPAWVRIIFKGSAPTFEMGIPLKYLQSTYTGLSKTCLQHFVHFSTSFPQKETEINAHMLLHFPLHREMQCTLQVDVH